MKKIMGMVIAVMMVMQSLSLVLPGSVFSAAEDAYTNQARELMTKGNQLVYKDDPDTVVRLTGMNVPGGEWTGTPGAERVLRSVREAIYNWNTNLIRLPVGREGWYGEYSYVNDGGRGYRAYIDRVIRTAAAEGRYVVLDLHHYKSFNNQKYLDFWKEACEIYGNNPAVLFGILNEPHSTSWEVWRDGDGAGTAGHQQVVEMIRDLGAKNIIVAGGLDYAYKIDECMEKGLLLADQGSNGDTSKTGNGIMYDTHIYPWKGHASNWDKAVGDVRKNYPILVGESGWDPATNLEVGKKEYKPGSDMYHDKWMPELMAWMNDEETYGNLANWTGWCFHPRSAPRILDGADDWGKDGYDYPPTDFCGVYVKEQLEKDVGINIASRASVTAESDAGYTAASLIDGKTETMWKNSTPGEKVITLDFGGMVTINRWRVKSPEVMAPITEKNAGQNKADNLYSFRIETSLNGEDWGVLEVIQENWGGYLERQVRPTKAQYLRFVITQGSKDSDTANICDIDIFAYDDEVSPVGVYEEPFTDGTGALAANLGTTYIAQDFEEAVSSGGTILVPNTADGRNLAWTMEGNGYTVSEGDEANPTAYLSGQGTADDKITLTLPDVIGGKNDLVYFDTRIKRTSLTAGDVSLAVKDPAGNPVYELAYPKGSIPILYADETYGSKIGIPAMTEVTYPYTDGWVYVRTVFNQADGQYEMYTGDTLDDLRPLLLAPASFGQKSPEAWGIQKIELSGTSGLCVDDLRVYTVDAKVMGEDDYIRGNIGSGEVTEKYVIQNFTGASAAEGSAEVIVTNLVNRRPMQWVNMTGGTENLYTVKTEGENAYLGGVRHGGVPVKLDIARNADGNGQQVYADLRVRRESLVDKEVTLTLKDNSGKEIVGINYPRNGGTPQVYGDQVYGNGKADTTISYPAADGWVYLRMMLDFRTKTLRMYQGEDSDHLAGMDRETAVFGFKDNTAANLREIYISGDGALNIDDLRICAGMAYEDERTPQLEIQDVSYGSEGRVKVQVNKTYDEALEGQLYISVSEGRNTILVKQQSLQTGAGKLSEQVVVPVEMLPRGNYTVKAFLWNEDLRPLAEGAEYLTK